MHEHEGLFCKTIILWIIGQNCRLEKKHDPGRIWRGWGCSHWAPRSWALAPWRGGPSGALEKARLDEAHARVNATSRGASSSLLKRSRRGEQGEGRRGSKGRRRLAAARVGEVADGAGDKIQGGCFQGTPAERSWQGGGGAWRGQARPWRAGDAGCRAWLRRNSRAAGRDSGALAAGSRRRDGGGASEALVESLRQEEQRRDAEQQRDLRWSSVPRLAARRTGRRGRWQGATGPAWGRRRRRGTWATREAEEAKAPWQWNGSGGGTCARQRRQAWRRTR